MKNRPDSLPRPPRLAEGMIWLLTPAHSREPVLGDLAEEYTDISQRQTQGQARAWYWNQVLTSLPHLLNWLMRGSQYLAGFVALALGYLVLGVALSVVFALFHQLYTLNLFQGMVVLALGVRLGLEALAMLGGSFAAGIILAQGDHLHWRRLTLILLLFAALILLPSLFRLATGTHFMPQPYLLARMAMTLPVLVIGAVAGRNLVRWFERRRSL
jgi:hypothetical protein